jgi:alpha-tubulin suppressor-like RCC1 family protein
MFIGKMPSQAAPGLGLILHGLRWTNKAVYTGAFTPPTSPLGVTGSAGTNIQEVGLGEVSFLFACDRVPYHGSFTQISAGPTNAAATTAIGRLANWGSGTTGQLAEVVRNISRSNLSQVGVAYPLVSVSVPTAVNESSSWTAVSAGRSYSLAIRSDSTLFAWGANPNGLLGTGDTLTRSSPIQIGTFSWSQINAGVSHTLGITTT